MYTTLHSDVKTRGRGGVVKVTARNVCSRRYDGIPNGAMEEDGGGRRREGLLVARWRCVGKHVGRLELRISSTPGMFHCEI
jgi:hypothetical protein